MYKCSKCDNVSPKEHIVCKCGSVGEYKPYDKPKKVYNIPKVSTKKRVSINIDATLELSDFFNRARGKMTGLCQCCGGKTEKDNNVMFHFSVAHILPKAKFKSIATNDNNWVELCFYGNSCHTNYDNNWVFLEDNTELLEIVKGKYELFKDKIDPSELRKIPTILKH